MKQFMTESERKQYARADMMPKLQAALKTLPPTSQYIAAALAGSSKRGWYARACQAIEAKYGADDVTFTYLLAALSPRVSLETNVANAIKVFDQWVAYERPKTKAGIVFTLRTAIEGELMGAWIPNAVRALDGRAEISGLSGPKVDSFARNLLGDLYEVANDGWMATFAGVSQNTFSGKRSGLGPGKSPGYMASTIRVRQAAKLLGWQPAEVQECIWSFTKTAYETASAHGTTVVQLLKDNRLTTAQIGATPDIHSLFAHVEAQATNSATMSGDLKYLLPVARRLDKRLEEARNRGDEPNF